MSGFKHHTRQWLYLQRFPVAHPAALGAALPSPLNNFLAADGFYQLLHTHLLDPLYVLLSLASFGLV